MPIHLRPISRRQFLARSLAATAALALSPTLLAARKSTDPDSWALFSDIHVAADPQFKARGINMTEHFAAASRQVLELPKRPAGLFVTGDCAYNSGQTEDYRQVANLLAPLRGGGIPLHLALGNHDHRERYIKAFPGEKPPKHSLGGKCVSLLRTKRVNWFVLDSLEMTLSTPGLLGPEQLQWLARKLDNNHKKPALVLLHHNPGLEGGNMGLKDTAALLEVLRPRKQVKAYIYGHTHNWKLEQDSSGLHLVNLPAVAYVFREGEPSGWVHARVAPDGMDLQLRCVDPGHKLNAETHQLKWRV